MEENDGQENTNEKKQVSEQVDTHTHTHTNKQLMVKLAINAPGSSPLSRPGVIFFFLRAFCFCVCPSWRGIMPTSSSQGFTGHPMGVSFEDVAAVEVLHRGVLPPTANNPVVDPTLVRVFVSPLG